MSETNILEAHNIVKQYAGHRALNDVSISVPKQSVFGLLGPNGAGKTSLIRIINQITAPDAGQVILDGKPLERSNISDIGYLPEERGLYKKMKAGEQAIYLAQLKGMDKKEAKKKLQAWFEKFDLLPWWNKSIEELSKGMAQKIQFITTILHEPKLLILDEPFSGFDPINAQLVRNEIIRLKDEGATIILSTHNMASVEEICDNIALINKSQKVLDGSVNEIRNKFYDGKYKITFKGSVVSFANAVWGGWELIHREQIAEETFEATIKLSEGNKLNNYLRGLLDHVEIINIQQVIPSMNDIFIQAVESKSQTEETLESNG